MTELEMLLALGAVLLFFFLAYYLWKWFLGGLRGEQEEIFEGGE